MYLPNSRTFRAKTGGNYGACKKLRFKRFAHLHVDEGNTSHADLCRQNLIKASHGKGAITAQSRGPETHPSKKKKYPPPPKKNGVNTNFFREVCTSFFQMNFFFILAGFFGVAFPPLIIQAFETKDPLYELGSYILRDTSKP